MATLNGAEVGRAVVTLPGYGIWSARVTLARSKVIAAGARVTLVIGDLTLSGTVRSGGDFVGASSYLIVGGADGWARPVKDRPYRGDNGIRLSQVAADLATDTGDRPEMRERVVIEPGAETALGYAWSRPAGVASSALDEVARRAKVRWWMTPDGITHLGRARPARALSARLRFVVERFDPSKPRAVVSSPDDAIEAFQPGTELRAPGVASFTIAAAVVRVEPGSVTVEASGFDVVDLARGLVAPASRRALYLGLHPYEVQEQTGQRLTLRAVESTDGLPDQLAIDKAHGVPGASAVCRPGSIVLVGWKGGSPGAPYVALYLPSTPIEMTLDAESTITLGGAGAGALAKAGATDAAIEALRRGIATVATAAKVPVPPEVGAQLGTVATVKVRGE